MSFATRFSEIQLCPLADGQIELLRSDPTETESGFDSQRDTWLIRLDSAGHDPNAFVADNFLRGTQLLGQNMWIVSRTPRIRGHGLAEVTTVSMGLLSARGAKVRYDAGTSTARGANILLPAPQGESEKVAVSEGNITASIEFVAIGTVTPDNAGFFTAAVGTAVDPVAPWKPATPGNIWSFITEPTENYPFGWIYRSASCENLPGLTTVWLVRQTYQYQQRQTL